jgi:hypothetical protein
VADNAARCATHDVSLVNLAFFRCGCRYYGPEASPASPRRRELDAAHLETIRDLANAPDRDEASIDEVTLRAALAETVAEIDRLRARPRPRSPALASLVEAADAVAAQRNANIAGNPHAATWRLELPPNEVATIEVALATLLELRSARGTTRPPWPRRDELAALAAVVRDQRETDDRRDPSGVPVEAPKGHVFIGLVDRELDTLEQALALLVDGAPNMLGITTEGSPFSAYANEIALLALRTSAKAAYGFVVDGDRGTGGMPLIAGLASGPEYRARCRGLASLMRRSAALLEADVDRQVPPEPGEVKP